MSHYNNDGSHPSEYGRIYMLGYRTHAMKNLLIAISFAVAVAGCSSVPDYIRTPHPEVSGLVESWGKETQSASATLSIWKQKIKEADYALFQVRADLDTYRFALSRDQLEGLTDAINNYQLAIRQSSSERTSAVGWLYRADVKLKRLGNDAKDDRLIINIERKEGQTALLTLTFESWLLSFGGPDSPADRAYKLVAFSAAQAETLRTAVQKVYREL